MLKVKTFNRLYEQTNQLNEAQQLLQKEIEVRKEAEEALNKTVKELHTILEALPQIAFTADADGRIDYVNEHWFEYADSNQSFPKTAKGDISIELVWRQAVLAGKELEMEVQIENLKDKELKYYLLRALPVYNDSRISKWVGTFTDIDHQKQLNDLLEQKVNERTIRLVEANKDLEASNHDLQQFASVASHDLKEPLRKIQVFSNILRDKFFPDQDNQLSTYLDKIIVSSKRMSKLINDLLDYSRLSQANLFELTDLNEIVKEILSDLELTIADKQAVFHCDHLPELVVIPGLIRQLFQNIISNALKFSKPGEIPIITITSECIENKKVRHKPEFSTSYCVIKISDNGIGFNEKYLDKIFTIFQRLNSKELYEGTGIGLAIAKKIVDKHYGEITAESKENEGATFIISLPVKQTTEAN
jgi:signal transduction histidine kinase